MGTNAILTSKRLVQQKGVFMGDLYVEGGAVAILTMLVMTQIKKVVTKRWLPIVALGTASVLGTIVTLLQGGDWVQALLLGLSGGGGSMAIHDTMKSMKPTT